MKLKQLKVKNYKVLRNFSLSFTPELNIIVGDNEAGKSTILECINLALTGFVAGRFVKNELSQHLFNNEAVREYLASIKTPSPKELPEILVEIDFDDGSYPEFEGNWNSEKMAKCGFAFRVAFNESFKAEFEALVKSGDVDSLPIEYYDVSWCSYSREQITTRAIPMKSALIDSASSRYQNGSDIYISRIIRNLLSTEETISVSQAHRKMKEAFSKEEAIAKINSKIGTSAKVSNKAVKLSVEFPGKHDWEESLATFLDEVPFQHVGKGEQCLVKANLALSMKEAKEAAILLLEEPENHLSHGNLNRLIRDLRGKGAGKQIIITTHSSFVANKLGLDSLILIHQQTPTRFENLEPSTKRFFEKISGYDTLRLVLAKKAILVEGDSDELIVQKAYFDKYFKLPIEDGIDVISVGTAFLRFLEIAERIKKPTVVVIDNDGDPEAVKKKFERYLNNPGFDFVSFSFDSTVDADTLEFRGKPFNYNTLEPKLVKANSFDLIQKILGVNCKSIDDLHLHMRANKTDSALKIFESKEKIAFPQYILDAIKEK